MNNITIKCPAKINLNLKIIGRRPDGFHNIESVMQTINLYDYLTIKTEVANETIITLNGNNDEIPYDKSNLVYKAAELFCKTISKNVNINIFIDKHIPVSAGLAGGSTDAAGTLYGLNELFNKPLTEKQLHELCSQLGSDLNVCLKGGRIFAKGRGEILESQPFKEFNLSIIKPKNLGISAKEAYTKFTLKDKTDANRKIYVNDLEWAVISDYPQLQYIKNKYPQAIMTGSGSAYYLIDNNFDFEKDYIVINELKSIPYGVSCT